VLWRSASFAFLAANARKLILSEELPDGWAQVRKR